MKVAKFEDLEIWQIARELYRFVFKLSSIKPFSGDLRFKAQIRASSGSISDNIAEGFGRGGNKEFLNFLSISKGSCSELRNQSYRAYDSNYIDDSELKYLLEETDKLLRKTTKLIIHLKSTDSRGVKYD